MARRLEGGRARDRLTVVHLIGAGVGGAEQQLLALLSHPAAATIDHRVLLVRDGPLADDFRAVLPTEDLGKRRAVDPGFFVRLLRALRRHRPDVLNTWTHTPNLWGPIAARLAGVPSIVLAEVGLEDWKGPLLRIADRASYRLADHVVGCADAVTAAAVARGARLDRTTTVPLAVTLPDPAPAPPSGRTVVLLGRYDFRKGHRDLVHAFSDVLRTVPDARLLFAGPAASQAEQRTRAEVASLVGALGLDAAVHMSGALPMPEAMTRAAVIVVPSLSEGLPNVVLEAMAYRRPVVATAVGGIPEVVVDGVTGWLVPPGDRAALVAALIQVLLDPDEAERRAGAAVTALGHRSVADVLAQWHRVYERLDARDRV